MPRMSGTEMEEMDDSRTQICLGSNLQDIYWKKKLTSLFNCPEDKIAEETLRLRRQLYPPVENPERGPVGETLLHRLILGDADEVKKIRLEKSLQELLKEREDTSKDFLAGIVNHPYKRTHASTQKPPTSYKQLVFDGETALHLAIAFENESLVEQLITLGADITARAYGSTFAPGPSKTYFGEYPLSLAAATGNENAAAILLKHYRQQQKDRKEGSQRQTKESAISVAHDDDEVLMRSEDELYRKRDTFGNTAFHIAIINHQIDFYIYLVKYANDEAHGGLSARLISELHGAMGLTPLTLSVLWYPKGDGFRHVLDTFKGDLIWKFSHVEARIYPLQQIDSVPADKFISVIYLVTRYSILELAEDHLLLSILDEKWTKYLQIPAYVALLVHLVYLAVITAYTVLLHPHGRLDDRRAVTLQQILLVITGGYFLGFLYDVRACVYHRSELKAVEKLGKADTTHLTDVISPSARSYYKSLLVKAAYPDRDVEMHSLLYYFGIFVTTWDLVGWIGTFFVFAHTVTRPETDLSSDEQLQASVPSSYILLGIGASCMWVSTLSYMNMYEKTGLLVSMISRTIVWDFLPFVTVFTSIICGVSVAIFAIQRKGMSLPQVIDLLKRLSIGVYQHETFEPEGHGQDLRIVSYIFLLIFTLVSLLLLLNLLIATLTTTYQQYVRKVRQIWSIQKASRILLWESRFRYFRQVLRINNTHTTKEYIHVGKVTSSGPEGTFRMVPNKGKRSSIPDTKHIKGDSPRAGIKPPRPAFNLSSR